jgi:hypothetical protein
MEQVQAELLKVFTEYGVIGFEGTFTKYERWHVLCTFTGRSNRGHDITIRLGQADAQTIASEGPTGSHFDMALSQKTPCRESD